MVFGCPYGPLNYGIESGEQISMFEVVVSLEYSTALLSESRALSARSVTR